MASLEQLLRELKRRKVYRAAAWYMAGAFALWQAAGVAFPVLGFPPIAMRMVVVGALAGFPVVVALSWAYDLRTEADASGRSGARHAAAVGIIAALLTIGGFGLWMAASPGPRGSPGTPPPASAARVKQITFSGSVGFQPRLAPDGEFVLYEESGPRRLLVRDLSSESAPVDFGYVCCSAAWSGNGSEILAYGRMVIRGRRVEGVLAFPRLGGPARILLERPAPERVSAATATDAAGRCLYRVPWARGDTVGDRLPLVCEHLDGRGGADTAWVWVPPGDRLGTAIAPDGSRVLAAVKDARGRTALHLLSTRGNPPRTLLEGDVQRVVWTRSGRIYALRTAEDGDEIVALDTAGAVPPRRIFVARTIADFDVAADGSRLVFLERHAIGNVWLYDIGRDRLLHERAITQGTAGSRAPDLEAGSGRIAFVQRGDMYLATNAAAAPERLTSLAPAWAGKPAWSDDGKRLALPIHDSAGAEVGVLSLNSRSLSRIPWPGTDRLVALAWASDSVLLGLDWGGYETQSFTLRTLGVGGGVGRILVTGRSFLPPGFIVSPDRSRLALLVPGRSGQDSLLVLDLNDGTRRKLRAQEYGWPMAWTRDGALVLNSGSLSTGEGEHLPSQVFFVSAADGRLLRRITLPETCNSGVIEDVAVDRDGRRLACAQWQESSDLWLVDGLRRD